ncbi:hypothetical protein ACS0TY_014733 [Phlomoides rotata]
MNGPFSKQNYSLDQVVERISKFKARHDCWHMMINTTRCVWDREFSTICHFDSDAWEFWLDVDDQTNSYKENEEPLWELLTKIFVTPRFFPTIEDWRHHRALDRE